MLDLGIVIVNWNTRDLLKRCLRTVFDSEGDFTYCVVVVDNASADGSAAMVRRLYPQARLIANGENIGYPRANNVGLRALGFRGARDVDSSAPRYALLLNPDTEAPADALWRMIQFMDSRPDIGVAGPKLVLPRWPPGPGLPPRLPHAHGQFLSLFGLGEALPAQSAIRPLQHDLRR